MKTKAIVWTLVLCFLGVGSAYAADAFMGTWKLNEAKSKFSPGSPKNTTVVYEAAGDNVKVVEAEPPRFVVRHKERHPVGPQPDSQAEVSSASEEVGNSAVRLPCLSPWQCHAARPDRYAHGRPLEAAGACRGADHDGLHARRDRRRTQDGR